MKAAKLLIVLAFAMTAFVSCKKDDAARYGTATVNGVTYNKVEYTYIATQEMEDMVIFRLIFNADKKDNFPGHIFYELLEGKWCTRFSLFDESEYNASVDKGACVIEKTDKTHYKIDIDGTDSFGKKVVFKGTASLTESMMP